MKPVRLLLSAALLSLATVALAQPEAPTPAPPKSEAQTAFDTLKSLAGEWEGDATLVPPMPGMSGDTVFLHVSLRVTSRGHVLVHEVQQAGTPLDPDKYDHPVTMLYLDGDMLNLVHYCDAGNRPRMVGQASPDGKTVEFELADVSGGTAHGHMDHAVFTYVDPDHHTEDWTFIPPGGKTVHAHVELRRMSSTTQASW